MSLPESHLTLRPAGARPLATPRRWAALTYRVLAWMFVSGVIVQVFLAGLSIFVDAAQWNLHTGFVPVLELLALLMLLFAFLARAPVRVRWLTAGAFGLIYVQYVTANVPGVPAALHPVNALLIFWLAVTLARQARGADWPLTAAQPAGEPGVG